MNIEIHKPELEALIEQRMASDRFQSIEDDLLDVLETSADIQAPPQAKESLAQTFTKGRGLLAGIELDLSRDEKPARTVDLS